jgi:hypothetical protein
MNLTYSSRLTAVSWICRTLNSPNYLIKEGHLLLPLQATPPQPPISVLQMQRVTRHVCGMLRLDIPSKLPDKQNSSTYL